ncbi:sugar phosphate isomerase/epimerase family protein [Larkinella bovis]|uniref:Sugar phosphate isomerase/epimerase family protein n=1 Tax=Larkinella bovis TaxID=683041 RepID=A0ABW0IB63_9BACT
MEEHFRIAQELGFKTLEFGIGGGQKGRLSDELTETERRAFLALKQDYGIITPFCCLENDFTLPDAEAHQQMVAYVRRLLPVAKELGATHVRLFAGFTPSDEMTEEIWQRLFSAFAQCQADSDQLGIQLAIETHGQLEWVDGVAVHRHTVSTHPADVQRLLAGLPAAVGFNFDPGNLKAVAPNDRSFLLRQLRQRINYCHLKDWKREKGGWLACAIGDDDLDYKPVFESLGYEGVCLIEYEPLDDVPAGIRRSLEYLDRLGVSYQLV